ncbi:MAG: hypothetical protein IPN71_10655 [Fibrobacteres bacterium]|nr:hypothetical protein [Fibrobacterota bacterium]
MRIRVLACLLLTSATSFADVLMKGYHGVTRKVCYQVEPDGPRSVIWVNFCVSGPTRHQYQVLKTGDCPDQGYKFNYVKLFRVDSSLFQSQFPSDELNPDTLPGWIPVTNVQEGQKVASNYASLPDSIPINYQEWTYRIRGSWYAMEKTKQGTRSAAGAVTFSEVKDQIIQWPEISHLRQRETSAAFALISADGRHVRLRIPQGEPATLRVVSSDGQILRSLRVASTQGQSGSVDLGIIPPAGSVVELRRAKLRSTLVTGVR